jgi:OOP family OmpA-OmpF porin
MIRHRLALLLCGFFFLAGVATMATAAVREAQKPDAEQPREFVVFFGFGSSSLSPDGATIVASASSAVKQTLASATGSHVKVIGYSDTTGSNDAAQRLSERRAAMVRDELVRGGVDAAKIETEGRGKSELAVPTSDRTREPRNRRVRIVIYGPDG